MSSDENKSINNLQFTGMNDKSYNEVPHLTIEMFKKFCQDKENQEKDKMIENNFCENEIYSFNELSLQFGDLLTCDLVIQHLDRQYFSHKSALSSILDMNALGVEAFVIEYRRCYHSYLEKTVEIFTINESCTLFHLAQFIFYGYYKRFPFEQFSDNRVAEFMTEIVTQHDSYVVKCDNEHIEKSITEIYDHFLKDVFIIPKKAISVEEYKERLIDMLNVSVKFKVVLIIDEILNICDFRINWLQMYMPFTKLKYGGTLGKVVNKLLNNIANNFEEMIESPTTDWKEYIKEFNYQDLSSLLRKDTLRVSNEMQVWNTFYVWAIANQNKTSEIGDFVCHILRYGLLQTCEIHQIFSDLYKFLPKEMYQSIYLNYRRNYSLINSLLCTGKLVCYKNRIFGDAHHATRLRKFTEIVLIFGGWIVGTQANFVECYVPSLNLIFDIVEFPMFDMGAYFACEYFNGSLYIYGGSVRDSLSNKCMSMKFDGEGRYKWIKRADMSINRCYIASCVYKNKLIALGGFDGQKRLTSVECFDPEKNAWNDMPQMTHARSDACAVVLNDRIYIAGGINTNCIENTVEMYDPIKKKWTLCADMLIPRTSFAMVAFKDRLWALGGNSGTKRVASVDSYDPITNTWQIESSMNEARSTFKAIVYRNNIYVFGGYNGGGPMATVEKYDPNNGTWTIENNLHFDRSGHAIIKLPYDASSKFEIPSIESVY